MCATMCSRQWKARPAGSEKSESRPPTFRPAGASQSRAAALPRVLTRPVSRLRSAVEGPKVGQFKAKHDGVVPGMRAEFGVAADPEASIPAATRRVRKISPDGFPPDCSPPIVSPLADE